MFRGTSIATAVLVTNACQPSSHDARDVPAMDAPATASAAPAPRPVRVSRQLPNPVAYIPPQCYTRTSDGPGTPAHNPCYVCHVRSRPPNFVDDVQLQLVWSLPPAARNNPWTNLFSPAVARAVPRSDEEILAYVRKSNYFDDEGHIALAEALRAVPAAWDDDHDGRWAGFVPDVWYRFDDRGFDHRPDGSADGWRAYAYDPFPGTFFPTNGSMGDVLIRLDPVMRQDAAGREDLGVYAVNLAIVEALAKRADVAIDPTDEKILGVDLDLDGALGRATRVAFDGGDGTGATRMRYVGRARDERSFPIAPGLLPLRTELFHSVRYLDVAEGGGVRMAARMKELRYAKKVRWLGYTALRAKVAAETIEQRDAHDGTIQIYSELERGVANGAGWILQGFIEDRDGALRPQTFEESVFCVGCHGGIGVTTDSVFSLPRKLASRAGSRVPQDGWFHGSQHDLHGLPEPRGRDGRYEYTRYLAENGAGDELRENAEVIARFFDAQGALRPDAVARLHSDISTLLVPSPERALALDRAYRAVVDEQSFDRGRDAVLKPAQHVHPRPPLQEKTGIPTAIDGM